MIYSNKSLETVKTSIVKFCEKAQNPETIKTKNNVNALFIFVNFKVI